MYLKSWCVRKVVKRVCFLLVSIMFFMPKLYAQEDSYTKAFVELLKSSPKYDVTEQLLVNFKPFLKEVNHHILKDTLKSEELINRYSKRSMANDVISVLFVPIMRTSISEIELRQYVALINTPPGKLFMEHEKGLMASMSATFFTEIISVMQDEKAREQLNNGNLQLPPVKINAEIPQNYIDMYNKFYGDGDLYTDLIKELKKSYLSSQNMDAKSYRLAQQMLTYIEDNMSTILLNSSYGVMTYDDWQFGVGLTPYLRKITKGMTKIFAQFENADKLQNMGTLLMMKYVVWLQGENVKLKL